MNRLLTLLLAACLGTAAVAAPPPDTAASGPTPYPSDAKDWPGQGAIRVFGWMTDNRKAFWTERERKQLAGPDGSPVPELFGADRLHISAAGFERFRDALAPVLKQLDAG